MKNKAKSLAPFFAVMFLFNMAANFVHPVTPTIIVDLNLNDYMFGLALSAMMAFNFLFSPFWGKMAMYISSKKVMLICGIGYALGQVFFGIAKTEIQFLLARMFAGAFCGGSYVVFMTYTVNCSTDENRGKNIALNAMLSAVSSAFGYFVGGMIGEINAYCSVWLQVAVLIISSVIHFFILRDDSIKDLSLPNGKAFIRECNPFSAIAQSWRFMSKIMILLFASCVLINLGYNAFEQCFNYYLRDQFQLSSGYNGAIKAALGVINLLSNATLCMWIMKKKNASVYLVGVILICTVSTLGVIFFSNAIPFVLFNVIFFTFYFISLPLAQNSAAELGKGERSNLVMGSFNAVKSFGGIFGSALAGFLYEFHAKLPFVFGLVSFGAATLTMILFAKEDRKAKG